MAATREIRDLLLAMTTVGEPRMNDVHAVEFDQLVAADLVERFAPRQ